MWRIRSGKSIAIVVAFAFGCGSVHETKPCEGVDCSGHGACRVEGDRGRCICEEGFEPEGLTCVEAGSDSDADADTDSDVDSDADLDTDTDSDACPDVDRDLHADVGCGGDDCNDGEGSIHPGADDNVGIGGWTTEVVDSGALGEGFGVNPGALARGEDGSLHVAYYRYWGGSTDELRYATKGGAAWSATVVDEADCYDASLAMDAAGDAHIMCSDGYELIYVTNASGGWIAYPIETGGRYNALALDADGARHVTFFHDEGAGVGVALEYGTDAGGGWTFSTIDTGGISGTSLALDADGDAHAGYYHAATGELRYASNAAGAWDWETVDATARSSPSIAVVAAGSVYLTYEDANGAFGYATNASGAWEYEVASSSGDARYGSAVVDSDGFVHASRGGVSYSTNESGAWTSADVGSGNVGSSMRLDDDGGVHLVWSRTEGGIPEVVYGYRAPGDRVDQNCDGVDGVDGDGDGHASRTTGGWDCDDRDDAVFPGADDPLGDGVDQDCDGVEGG